MADRQHLYRAKRKDNGEWVEGSLITGVFTRLEQDIPYILCPDEADYDCFEDFSEENGIFEVIPETVCECIGSALTCGYCYYRINMFKHDIVKFTRGGGAMVVENYAPEHEEIIAEVKIAAGCAIFVSKHFPDGYITADKAYFEDYFDCEVIGNIHDNPELEV